ncbi:MAG: tetratricopeptide repeat protein [Candidatus Omnitrophica bacterium]|nr:tetratricopeptide repeat protein [Candidatus Omnitrophota bacterium]
MAAPFEKTVLRRVPLVLCLLGFLAYGQTLWYPFVHDEIISIQFNPLITHFDWNEIIHGTGTAVIKNGGSSALNAYYRPLLELFYRIEYALFGLYPAGWHLFNILLHIANSFLVYSLINIFSGHKKGLAFAVSLLFLLHPVQTETVACISGVSNLVFAFFCFASIYLYCLGQRRADARMYWGSLTAFFLALLTKEQAVMLPVLVLWLERTAAPREGRRPPRRSLRVGGYFAVLAGYFVLRKFLMPHGVIPPVQFNGELFLRVLSIPRTLLMYLGTIFFPRDLHYYRSIDILEPAGGPAAGLLAVLLSVILIVRRTPQPYRRLLLAGAGWSLICLAPVLNIIPIINEYSLILTAEHFLYMSVAGVLLFVPGVGHFLISKLPARRQRLCAVVTVGILGMVCFVLTVRQNTVWAGQVPLIERTVRFEPNFSRAYMLLGDAYATKGEYARAIATYHRALGIMQGYMAKTESSSPRDFYALLMKETYVSIARCFDRLGDPGRAIEWYARADRIDPSQAAAHNHQGVSYLKEQNYAKAVIEFQEALLFDENNTMAMNNLAVCYLMTGRPKEAETILEKILRLNPHSVFARENLKKLMRAPQERGK